ncbi:MAG TPA: rRNA maturation RNAse YbeY, partial [Candidatus Binataceae bacterium]|nr:rRNA maturation RNAse YbeY [Candidatus Binataceae bacterium]
LGVAEAARLRTLLIHGVLHLVGYDHERSRAEARRMFARERELAGALAMRRRAGAAGIAVRVAGASIASAAGLGAAPPGRRGPKPGGESANVASAARSRLVRNR